MLVFVAKRYMERRVWASRTAPLLRLSPWGQRGLARPRPAHWAEEFKPGCPASAVPCAKHRGWFTYTFLAGAHSGRSETRKAVNTARLGCSSSDPPELSAPLPEAAASRSSHGLLADPRGNEWGEACSATVLAPLHCWQMTDSASPSGKLQKLSHGFLLHFVLAYTSVSSPLDLG